MMGSSFASKLRLWHIDADRVAGGVHLINAPDEVGAMASCSAPPSQLIQVLGGHKEAFDDPDGLGAQFPSRRRTWT